MWLIGLGFHANQGPRGTSLGEATMGTCKQDSGTRASEKEQLLDIFLVAVTAAKLSAPGPVKFISPFPSCIFLPFPEAALN